MGSAAAEHAAGVRKRRTKIHRHPARARILRDRGKDAAFIYGLRGFVNPAFDLYLYPVRLYPLVIKPHRNLIILFSPYFDYNKVNKLTV